MDIQKEYLTRLVDYTTLVYHEARNVRHLIKAEKVEPESWKYLVSLPTNRKQAWEALQDIRLKAQQANNVHAALLPFEQRFKVNLEQLQGLYENPAWHNAPYGGNAWKDITRLVWSLSTALEKENYEEGEEILERLSQARHNTGLLAEKLRQLNGSLNDAKI
jgi:hypothetical protein